jgi:hypothetical protein
VNRLGIAAAVCICLGTGPAAIAQQKKDSDREARARLDAAAAQWKLWHDSGDWRHMLATEFNWNDGEPMDYASFYRSSSHTLMKKVYRVRGQWRTYISFLNPKYFAMVRKHDGTGDYTLENLLSKDDPGFQQATHRRTSLEHPVRVMELYMWDLVLDPTRHELLGYSREVRQDDTLHHFHIRLPRGPVEITEIKPILSERMDLLPIENELTYAPDAGDMVVRVRWSGWKKIRGQWVWSQQHTEKIGEGPPRLVSENDWDPPRKHGKRECWLSYYGLPEPEGSGTVTDWSVSQILGGIAVFTFLVFVLLRLVRNG